MECWLHSSGCFWKNAASRRGKKICLGQRFKARSKISRCLETTESRPISKLILFTLHIHTKTHRVLKSLLLTYHRLQFLLLLTATTQTAKPRNEEQDALRLVPPTHNSGAVFRIVFGDRDFVATYLGLPAQPLCVQLHRSSSNMPRSTPQVTNQENEWIQMPQLH